MGSTGASERLQQLLHVGMVLTARRLRRDQGSQHLYRLTLLLFSSLGKGAELFFDQVGLGVASVSVGLLGRDHSLPQGVDICAGL